MFRLADNLRVYLHRDPIDFRAGINLKWHNGAANCPVRRPQTGVYPPNAAKALFKMNNFSDRL